MEYTEEQKKKITLVIEKLSGGSDDLKGSPSIRVMAINLLNTFNWDVARVMDSLR